MRIRTGLLWAKVRDSLWFLPGLFTTAAVLLAFGVTQAEMRGWVAGDTIGSWIFAGGVDGARGVLSTIASGLITVTGVVFSVTVVALQLASSQFTPRVLRNFMADRGNQVVLGVFIGTFTYTLLVLRTIHSATDDGVSFVPRLGVTVALALLLVSVGCLIFFINHAARSIQVTAILDRVVDRTVADIRRLYPARDAEPATDAPVPDVRLSAPVLASRAGYVQAVDSDTLFGAGAEDITRVVVEIQRGDWVLPGQILARVWPAELMDTGVADEIRAAFVLGPERTPHQDVEFGVIEVADIAVKALSPGINDPTTSLRCIDRLSEILLVLASRRPSDPGHRRGRIVRFHARSTHFEQAVELAYDQIRLYGASNPAVCGRLLQTLGALAGLVPLEHRPVLRAQAARVLGSARIALQDPADREAVESLAARSFPAGLP